MKDRPMPEELRSFLETLNPKARDDLRRVLIRDDTDRNAIGQRSTPPEASNGRSLHGAGQR
jgi:hypothetical protein